MRYKTNKIKQIRHKKWLILLIILASASLTYAKLATRQQIDPETKPENTVDYNPPTKTELDLEEEAKRKRIEEQLAEEEAKAPVSSVTLVQTYGGFQENGDYSIRVLFSDKITNEGKCSLSYQSPTGLATTESVNVSAGPNYTICNGFTLAKSSLSSGIIEYTVKYLDANGVEQGRLSQSFEVK